ncbi:MAG: hypothetical protein IPJ77_16760 [Planctomycetes bacterium]|nr:hypothetical protein [Planctomycetota bacterium]
MFRPIRFAWSRPSVLTGSLLLGTLGLCAAAALSSLPVPTTSNDFHQPGTQPGGLFVDIFDSPTCAGCHGYYDPNQEPYSRWSASLMAQSSRDPIFHAALAIANQDAADVGEFCLRCHTPGAWLGGRGTPADGSALNPALGDYDGVTCHLCHRLVDPYEDPANPHIDQRILDALAERPVQPHSGQYVVDPQDIRRGPFDLGPSFPYHDWRQSPYHLDSMLCGTCHEVSNPALSRQPNGDYVVNALNTPHPTQIPYDEFPIERTFSEWKNSSFARAAIDMGGRFGGNQTAVSSCQDCHMPKTTGTACNPVLGGAIRNDLPLHDFNGANSWVLDAVRAIYPDSETGLTNQSVAAAHQRTQELLSDAADLHTSVKGGQLAVRVVNQTGHKLPTGYGEGRRMWVNVKFFDAGNALVAERGAYDPSSAVLTTANTKVYEIDHGIDAAQSVATGLPVGPSFHFVLNNKIYKDNRIPPRGYTLFAFTASQALPVGYSYDEEQYWDDTLFAIPPGAHHAEVSLFHQTTTKEYIEFLRDTNTTNSAGLDAYNLWVSKGKSTPILMQTQSIVLGAASCLPPIQYGLAKQRVNGDYPSVSTLGTPSFAVNDLKIAVDKATPFQNGVLFFSAQQGSLPFHGGTLLLGGTIARRGVFTADATGHAELAIPIAPGMINTVRNYQAIFRDPAALDGYGVTNAVHVEFCN